MIRGLLFTITIVLAATVATTLRAADAGKGERLAQSHCAPCHRIGPEGRNVVAASPPFEVIARKYGFDADRIATAIAGPHRKMNFAPDPAEAADIAAYIAGLKQ
jgi:cytochrome c